MKNDFKKKNTLKLLEEILTIVGEANNEVENAIYDPISESIEYILDNYEIKNI